MGKGSEKRRRLPAHAPTRPAPREPAPWTTPEEVRERLTMDEKGNTLLVSDNGAIYFLAETAPDEWFAVRWLPENSPGFDTFFFRMTADELRGRVQQDFAGWYVRRNNLSLEVDVDMVAQIGD